MPTASLTEAVGASRPPLFEATDLAPSRTDHGAVAVAVLRDDEDLLLGPGGAELEEDLGLDVLDLLGSLDAKGTPGEVTRLPVSGSCVLLVGVGDGSPDSLRKAGAALARSARGLESVACSVAAVGGEEGLSAFVAGLTLGSFQFSLRTTAPESPAVGLVALSAADDVALARAVAIARASWKARWLATVPSNIKSPAWLVAQAGELAEGAGLTTRVWDERELADQGFGGIIAVGQGSATPPRLLRMDYEPPGADRRTPHVVLVGKGITFDTGGLSIKPGEAMVNMKRDMTGAAVVTGVMSALGEVGCAVRVTGLLACAENAIGEDAMRPGDVIRHYGGTTTEVTNTDAEGRLVLADALRYAVDELEPSLLVDVATLTGAMKVGLGLSLGGFFATHDAIADHLMRAGAASGERVWRMPIVEDYEHLLESKVADLDNCPTTASALTATLFLRHFTGGLPWTHLDIASVGDAHADKDEWTKGPTGFGVRLLLHWLGSADPLEGLT